MKKSVKKNYLYNLSYQILTIILPIITTPYLARVLGSNGTGIYSYTISIVTYFILFGSLGIALYGQREIAYVQNNEKKKNRIFTELVFLRLITMFIAAIIFFFTFGIKGEYSLYYKILLFEMLANAIDISWLYQGLEEFKKIVLRNFIVKIVSIICIFIFVKSPTDVWKYVAIYALTTLFGNVSLWFKLKNYAKFDFEGFSLKKHIKPMLLLFIPQVAIQIYTVLDKTMLGSILNDMNEVGYYEQAQKIVKILLTIISSLGTVMLPRIAKCYAEGKTKEINEYLKKSFNFLFFLSFPMMFGIIAVSSNFVPLFFGKGYDSVVPILSIMSILMLLIGMSNITGNQYLLPTKKQGQYTASVIIGACANFILNLLLIPNLKSIGASIATIIAEMLVTGSQLYFVRKNLDLKSYFKVGFKYLVTGIVMLFTCLGINIFIKSNIIGILVQGICGMIVYFGILYIIKDEFFLSCINNVKGFISKKIKKI